MSDSTHTRFGGSVAELYERHMVPLMFEPYARDLAERVTRRVPSSVLEIAAGTGIVTRALAESLPSHVRYVATDLNQPMIDHASRIGTARPVEWRQADVMSLPFADAEFDAVVCQFGAMFFPDKPRAYAEVRRVLKPGGTFFFNVWDEIGENEFAAEMQRVVRTLFHDDPPEFFPRTPHGYSDIPAIERDLAAGGFRAKPVIVTQAFRGVAPSARDAAIGLVQGSPLRNEIEARDPAMLAVATEAVAEALARRFGSGRIEGKIQAHIVVQGA